MKNKTCRVGGEAEATATDGRDREAVQAVLRALGYEERRIDRATVALFEDHVGTHEEREPLLTPRQLRERLAVSATTLWRLNPPYHMVGARKRYVFSEVAAFLKRRESAPNGKAGK
jgi:hypothetical protein